MLKCGTCGSTLELPLKYLPSTHPICGYTSWLFAAENILTYSISGGPTIIEKI